MRPALTGREASQQGPSSRGAAPSSGSTPAPVEADAGGRGAEAQLQLWASQRRLLAWALRWGPIWRLQRRKVGGPGERQGPPEAGVLGWTAGAAEGPRGTLSYTEQRRQPRREELTPNGLRTPRWRTLLEARSRLPSADTSWLPVGRYPRGRPARSDRPPPLCPGGLYFPYKQANGRHPRGGRGPQGLQPSGGCGNQGCRVMAGAGRALVLPTEASRQAWHPGGGGTCFAGSHGGARGPTPRLCLVELDGHIRRASQTAWTADSGASRSSKHLPTGSCRCLTAQGGEGTPPTPVTHGAPGFPES